MERENRPKNNEQRFRVLLDKTNDQTFVSSEPQEVKINKMEFKKYKEIMAETSPSWVKDIILHIQEAE